MSLKFAWLVLLLESCSATLVRSNSDVLATYPGLDTHTTSEQERGHLCGKAYYNTVKDHGKIYHGPRICHSMMIGCSFS